MVGMNTNSEYTTVVKSNKNNRVSVHLKRDGHNNNIVIRVLWWKTEEYRTLGLSKLSHNVSTKSDKIKTVQKIKLQIFLYLYAV